MVTTTMASLTKKGRLITGEAAHPPIWFFILQCQNGRFDHVCSECYRLEPSGGRFLFFVYPSLVAHPVMRRRGDQKPPFGEWRTGGPNQREKKAPPCPN